jgi:hypothetical protein
MAVGAIIFPSNGFKTYDSDARIIINARRAVNRKLKKTAHRPLVDTVFPGLFSRAFFQGFFPGLFSRAGKQCLPLRR